MYGRVAGTTFTAGAAGGALARTGLPVFGLVALALCLLVGGLVLLRSATVCRKAPADDPS